MSASQDEIPPPPPPPPSSLQTPTQQTTHTEELLQFKLQQIWILVDLPIRKRAIGTKWVFRNKKDERGIMIRNKARVQSYIEQIRGRGFMYSHQELNSPDNPDKVYKVVKALYGLHQAPRAWYETLANYLLGNGFKRGKIDQTLFIKKQKGDILLVQVYVDDIIFGSTNKELCTGFEKLMKDNQDKYVDEILKKFNYTDVKSASTPVDLEKPLVKDGDANDVDVHLYRSMIGSLMYLTTSRPDIMFAASQKEVGTLRYLSLVVPPKKVGDEAVHKELGDRIERAATTASSLEAKQESAYVDTAELLTTVRHNLVLPVQVNAAEVLGNSKGKTVNGERQLQALVDKTTVIIMETSIRSDLHLEDAGGIDCLPTATIFEELARMSAKTTA
ncbi:putative ribonuclease H-like domain-containing protein [Tanacetum coccineum]